MAERFRRACSATPALVLCAAALAAGTAAAPGRHARTPARPAPSLLATPATLAPALQLAPGDHVERAVELRRRGRGRFAAVYFVARTRSGSPLADDRRHGLQVALQRCPRRWTRRGADLVCTAKTTVVLAPRPLLGRTRLVRLQLTGTRPVHLALVLSLPTSAGGTLQGRAAALTYSFVGVARAR